MVRLFQSGFFTLSSGRFSDFKIDCDAISDEELAVLAYLLFWRVPEYSEVEGVASGGLRLAECMRLHASRAPTAAGKLLIVDDVLTSGGSMEGHRMGRKAVGGVLFARGPCPNWVTPLFTMTPGAGRV